MPRKLLLIDANSLIHRAYHALPHLSTSSGHPTNAVFGLAQMLLALLQEQAPDEVAMVFDMPGGTFRHEMYQPYKANRPEMDEELAAQYPLIREFVEVLRVPVIQKQGYEADDIIGTLSAHAYRQGYETVIVSGDRDLLQLINEQVRVMITLRGMKEVREYDIQVFTEEYGLKPKQLIDIKALAGDSSDNIPGLPGIGPKTAAKLLASYGDVEGIFDHLDELPPTTARKFKDGRDVATLCKRLATIVLDVPLDETADDLSWPGMDLPALRKFLTNLEFSSLVQRLPADEKVCAELGRRCMVADEDHVALVCQAALNAGAMCVVPTEFKGARALAIAAGTDIALCIPLPSSQQPTAQVDLFSSNGSAHCLPECLQSVLSDPAVNIYGCRLKQFDHLMHELSVKPTQFVFDAEVASYLLAPNRTDHSIVLWSSQYLGWDFPTPDHAETSGMPGWQARACLEALAVLQLRERFLRELRAQDMLGLFTDLEMPLIQLLARMERAGIGIDLARLAKLGEEFASMMRHLTQQISELAGEKFNVDSPKQVGEVLFERLKLPGGKKTKTGWSTAAGILEDLAQEHEIVRLILEYRIYSKLCGTYVDGIAREADPVTGLVHTTFEQTVASTGRLASRNPNLQNIPVKTEWGRKVRSCFNAGINGYSLICADYSQIELRILAHMSQDPTLLDAFANYRDIHTLTAQQIFDCEENDVDYRRRSIAKTVNYAVLYGMGPRALAESLDVTVDEAKKFIHNYHERMPQVQQFIDATVAYARENGHVSTLMGRRRPVPDLTSPNPGVRAYAERAAANAPLQGSAADIVKLAMLNFEEVLHAECREADMLLQVHDEIVLRAPLAQVPMAAALVKEVMESAYSLSVPLLVDVSVGMNWRDLDAFDCSQRDLIM